MLLGSSTCLGSSQLTLLYACQKILKWRCFTLLFFFETYFLQPAVNPFAPKRIQLGILVKKKKNRNLLFSLKAESLEWGEMMKC